MSELNLFSDNKYRLLEELYDKSKKELYDYLKLHGFNINHSTYFTKGTPNGNIYILAFDNQLTTIDNNEKWHELSFYQIYFKVDSKCGISNFDRDIYFEDIDIEETKKLYNEYIELKDWLLKFQKDINLKRNEINKFNDYESDE